MTITIKTFHSGIGDCVFLKLNIDEKQFAIMVDCGTYEEPIQQYVKDVLGKKIDLLIVTHIDNDHIMGVKEMLTDSEMKIGRIVYNCYQRKGVGVKRRLNTIQLERLKGLEKEIGLVVGDIIEHDVNASEAIMGLAATILGTASLKRVWNKDYTVSGNEIDLVEWGRITFLSPTMVELEELDEVFRHVLFDELNVDQTMGVWNKKEELYEILLRYAMLQSSTSVEINEKNVAGADTLEDRMINAAKEPVRTDSITPENKASLAFVWEKDEHRILILGDANPDIVVKGLLDHYKEKAFPVVFDAIKVSHHGSHYNTTQELIRHVDSAHYFFTGGTEGKRPSEEVLGRIVLLPLLQDIKKRELHFNYETSLVKELKDDKALQNKYHFKVDTTKNEKMFTL